MIRFLRRRKRELPSVTGLIILFLLTMALPAVLLLIISLELAGKRDVFLEDRLSRIFDRLAEGFQSELEQATTDAVSRYLNKDWSRFLDSPEELAAELESTETDVYLFGVDGTLLFPLFPPSPFQESYQPSEDVPSGWRRALAEARSIAEGGDLQEALEGFQELRRHPLRVAQRAELLLEEAGILAGRGNSAEARDRLEQLIRQYPDVVSGADIPLALTALAAQVDLFDSGKPQAFQRLAYALYLGAYYPNRKTEQVFWRRIEQRRDEIPDSLRRTIEKWKKRRNEQWERARFLRRELEGLIEYVEERGSHSLRIRPSGGVDSGSPAVELIHHAVVENESMLVVWYLHPSVLKKAVEGALQEVIRFNASAYLSVRTPEGEEWVTGGPEAPVARSLPLDPPWTGWSLQLGLEHAGKLREQAIRQREEAASIATIGALVLFIGTLLVFRGVRRQLQVTRAKSDFVSAVSHELRTPVANIRLYCEMLQMGVPETEDERKEALETITSETERLSRLIEGVLNYSRIQQGKKVFHLERVELVPIVEEVIERTRLSLEDAFEFRLTVQGNPERVTLDRDAFSQALENLLSNAVKYSRERREADVIVDFSGKRRIEVSVVDYGIGIARKNRKRIFERFHRVENALTRKTRGTGLGLTLARDLVRGFGGEIIVKSRLGEGSRFTIVLSRKKRNRERKSPAARLFRRKKRRSGSDSGKGAES